MEWIQASERLPEQNCAAKYGHHYGELVIHHGYVSFDAKGTHVTLRYNDPGLADIIWLDESKPSKPEQVGKEAIEFAQWANERYNFVEKDLWDGDNDETFKTAELYKLFNPKWAEQETPEKREGEGEVSKEDLQDVEDVVKQIISHSPTPVLQSIEGEEEKVYFVIDINKDLPQKSGWYNCYAGDEFLGQDYFYDGKFQHKPVTHWLKAGTITIPATLPAKDKTNEAGERK